MRYLPFIAHLFSCLPALSIRPRLRYLKFLPEPLVQTIKRHHPNRFAKPVYLEFVFTNFFKSPYTKHGSVLTVRHFIRFWLF